MDLDGGFEVIHALAYDFADGREADLAAIRGRLAEAFGLWRRFLEVEDMNTENPVLAYELTVLTSLLRVSHPSLINMESSRIPEVLLALYLYMLLYSGGKVVTRLLATYSSVLSTAKGLIYLTEKDLRLKDRPLHERLRYVQTLRGIYAVRLREGENGAQQKPE